MSARPILPGERMGLVILTTTEAAEHVGVSEATIWQWVKRGHLTPLAPGARPMRFLVTEVARCHAERQSKAWHDRLDALADRMLA